MELSLNQARKLILLSQGIHKERELGNGKNAVLKAIENLGYIQIDTISVIERAHHHTLWNRVNAYKLDHLNQLQQQCDIFEYWSHAAAFLPMRDYRFSLPRKQAIKSGREKHWQFDDKKVIKFVIDKIKQEGPLQAKDFEHKRKINSAGWWDWKPAKRALERLFMQGDLMITERQKFQKVYDLTERVLPDNINASMPSEDEFHRHLITNYLRANGIGTSAEISYLRKGIKPAVEQQCKAMVEDGQLIEITTNQQHYYALPNIEQLLAKPLSRNKVKILSPFDNLLIQRKRTKELFNFDYQIECYVPAAKRKFGYFVLPLLWGQEFAGRMDAKIDRKTGVLTVMNLYSEHTKSDDFLAALKPSLEKFVSFNGGTSHIINTTHQP